MPSSAAGSRPAGRPGARTRAKARRRTRYAIVAAGVHRGRDRRSRRRPGAHRAMDDGSTEGPPIATTTRPDVHDGWQTRRAPGHPGRRPGQLGRRWTRRRASSRQVRFGRGERRSVSPATSSGCELLRFRHLSTRAARAWRSSPGTLGAAGPRYVYTGDWAVYAQTEDPIRLRPDPRLRTIEDGEADAGSVSAGVPHRVAEGGLAIDVPAELEGGRPLRTGAWTRPCRGWVERPGTVVDDRSCATPQHRLRHPLRQLACTDDDSGIEQRGGPECPRGQLGGRRDRSRTRTGQPVGFVAGRRPHPGPRRADRRHPARGVTTNGMRPSPACRTIDARGTRGRRRSALRASRRPGAARRRLVPGR